MVAYLLKYDASKGFNQIIDFLNGSSIKYALTVNPNIYVSCINQFWTTVAVKQVNDVTRLQALVDKKKIMITEAIIRDVLRLDDAEGVDCLPNKEIFVELARMGYEKRSTKLTFYKAFFSSYLVGNVDSTTKLYMCPHFLQLIIRKQVGDLSTHTTKYTSPALTQKGDEEGDANEHVEEVTTGDAAEGGDDSAAYGEVPIVTPEQYIPSLTPTTPPPQPPQDILSTSQEGEETREEEQGKSVEAKKVSTSQRVDTSDDTIMDDGSNQGRMIAEMDQNDVVVLKDDKEENKEVADAVKDAEEAKEDETKPAEVKEVVDVVTTAKLITEVVTATSETVTASSAIIPTVEHQVPTATLTAAPVRVAVARSRRRKGVIIRDPEEESTTSTISPAKTKSKDKGKGILVKEPKPLKKKQQIKQDEQFARKLHAKLNKDIDWDEAINHVKLKAKEDPVVKRYQAMKRKPQTEAQARKNMMMYLKNIKEQMEEDENRALQIINETPAEKAGKRRKLNKEVEDLKRHLQIVPNEDDVYTEATPLARKVPVVDYEIIEMNNKPYYKIIRADGTHQLYINTRCTCSNIEESKNYTWSSKGQELEATGIMWCAYHNYYNHTANFVSGKETTASRRPARLMVEYILHQAQEQDLDQAS
nr:hypothetical protein [Tanacetum cinerariifolium]